MAISPASVYAGQTDTSDPIGYPLGKAQNETAFGARNGFPFEKTWVNDLFGFQQALLNAAGISPSGIPDKVGASDYLNALLALIPITRTWSEKHVVAASSAVVTSVAYDDAMGMFAAAWDISGAPAIATSVGGQLWTQQTLPISSDFANVQLARKPGGNFVAAGNCAAATASRYMTSPDGVTWTTRSSAITAAVDVKSIAWCPAMNLFVSTLGNTGVETSVDGVTWITRSCPITSIIGGGIASNGSIIVVCGGSTGTDIVYMTSPDGVVWTARTFAAGSTTRQMEGICWSATRGKFYLVHVTGSTPAVVISSSPDGITWTDLGVTPFPAGATSTQGTIIAEVGGRLAVAYTLGGIAYVSASIDGGASWQPVASHSELSGLGAAVFPVLGARRFVARTTHDTLTLSGSV